MKKSRLALLAGFFFCHAMAGAEVPWKNGEELTYEVNWGVVKAAEAVFTAQANGEEWVLSLNLKSKGVVEKVNPIRSLFTSRLQVEPWRSLGFEEDRAEGKKRLKNRTRVQYSPPRGHYEDLLAGTSADFKLPREEMDDSGSLLYAIRVQDWRKDGERTLVVYDGLKIKYGRARFVGESREAIGSWPKQKLLLIEAWPEDASGKRKKGSLKLWITDDERRLPLRADFEARFGTFEIDLVKVGTAPSL